MEIIIDNKRLNVRVFIVYQNIIYLIFFGDEVKFFRDCLFFYRYEMFDDEESVVYVWNLDDEDK